MKNRRQFLSGCAAAATVMALPAVGSILKPVKSCGDGVHDSAAFAGLQGERVSLREGGSVWVTSVTEIGSDPCWEQCLVQLKPSAAIESGIYHLQTADGSRALYLEAGGSRGRPTLTAALSRPRA